MTEQFVTILFLHSSKEVPTLKFELCEAQNVDIYDIYTPVHTYTKLYIINYIIKFIYNKYTDFSEQRVFSRHVFVLL